MSDVLDESTVTADGFDELDSGTLFILVGNKLGLPWGILPSALLNR